MKFLLVLLALQIAFSDAMFNSERVENIPYYAYVTFQNPQMSFYGGGALISNLHVLTCGANIQGFQAWRVGLGSNIRSLHRTLNSNRALAHPNYLEANNVRSNDIGIIFLTQPIELSESIFPIFLPTETVQEHPLLNVQGFILGFAGETTVGNEGLENLTGGHVRPIPHSTCLTHYPNAILNQHYCSEDREQRSNFCLGDQGGAFTTVTRGKEILVGIASLPGCTTIPSLYLRVGPYRQWIRSETGV